MVLARVWKTDAPYSTRNHDSVFQSNDKTQSNPRERMNHWPDCRMTGGHETRGTTGRKNGTDKGRSEAIRLG